MPLGPVQQTVAGTDVCLIDNTTTPGFSVFAATDAFALVDGGGTVVQFISVGGGRTVTAANGDAAGLTATGIGTASGGNSRSGGCAAPITCGRAPHRTQRPC